MPAKSTQPRNRGPVPRPWVLCAPMITPPTDPRLHDVWLAEALRTLGTGPSCHGHIRLEITIGAGSAGRSVDTPAILAALLEALELSGTISSVNDVSTFEVIWTGSLAAGSMRISLRGTHAPTSRLKTKILARSAKEAAHAQ